MRYLLTAFLFVLLSATAFAQTRHDANWCFGEGAGMHFNEDGSVDIFHCETSNFESCATFSSDSGNLLFYTLVPDLLDSGGIIVPSSGLTISNGDSINTFNSITNGGIFLPDASDSIYHYIYLGDDLDSLATGVLALNLMSTKITLRGNLAEVTKKNRILVKGSLQEKIAICKALEPDCWWVVTHNSTSSGCGNEFITLKMCNGAIIDSFTQQVGRLLCNATCFFGDMKFSEDGTLLIYPLGWEAALEIYNFDRCSGRLALNRTVTGFRATSTNSAIYGAEISNENIYLTESGGTNLVSIVYQYNLQDSILSNIDTFYSIQNEVWAIERAPNGKIYISHTGLAYSPGQTNNSTQCLSVIHNPDQPGQACNFEPFGFCFPDSMKMNTGLPNFPNYDLPPAPVFTVSAGRDTAVCSEDTADVLLGAPPVPNIVYIWQPADGLSATNIAQPIASPTQSTWYYLIATDTTATSCAINTDSIYIEVTTCTGLNETPTQEAKIYPNPTTGLLTIELPQAIHNHTFTLFNLLGELVLQKPLTAQQTSLQIDFAAGIYLYQITGNGAVQNGKLVVE